MASRPCGTPDAPNRPYPALTGITRGPPKPPLRLDQSVAGCSSGPHHPGGENDDVVGRGVAHAEGMQDAVAGVIEGQTNQAPGCVLETFQSSIDRLPRRSMRPSEYTINVVPGSRVVNACDRGAWAGRRVVRIERRRVGEPHRRG